VINHVRYQADTSHKHLPWPTKDCTLFINQTSSPTQTTAVWNLTFKSDKCNVKWICTSVTRYPVLRFVIPVVLSQNTMYKIMCIFTYTYSQNTTNCVLTVYICEYTHNFIHGKLSNNTSTNYNNQMWNV
jgi:hypothetical protein